MLVANVQVPGNPNVFERNACHMWRHVKTCPTQRWLVALLLVSLEAERKKGTLQNTHPDLKPTASVTSYSGPESLAILCFAVVHGCLASKQHVSRLPVALTRKKPPNGFLNQMWLTSK